MTISLKHNKTSVADDDGDASLIQPSDWNAGHALTLTGPAIIGRAAAGDGVAQEITLGTGLTLSAGGVLSVDTDALIAAMGIAVTALNTITPADSQLMTVTDPATGTEYKVALSALKTYTGGSGAGGADTTSPTFSSAAVSNAAPTQIVLTMSETLAAVTPAASAFAVSGGKTVSSVAVSGSTVTLTVSAAYAYGDTITVTYTKPGTSPLQDAAGNQTASFGPSAVTNNIANPGDVTPPTASSAAVANAAPTAVVITMSEAMNTSFVPAASAFTVGGHTVSAVAISGSTITLTVDAFVNGEAARTVAYTQPGTNNARDLNGNLLANFSGLAITNNVAAPAAATSYTLVAAASSGATGSPVTLTATSNGYLSSPVTITLSDGAGGGAFSGTITLAAGTGTSGSATYTPGSAGAKSITSTNNGALTPPAAVAYTATAPATTYVLGWSTGTGPKGTTLDATAAGTVSATVNGTATRGLPPANTLSSAYASVKTAGGVNAPTATFGWSNSTTVPPTTILPSAANTGSYAGNANAQAYVAPNGSNYFSVYAYLWAENGAGPYYLWFKGSDGAWQCDTAHPVTLTNY